MGPVPAALSDDKRVMFDRMDLLPQHIVYNGDPFHVKPWLDTSSLYDRTLYLDAGHDGKRHGIKRWSSCSVPLGVALPLRLRTEDTQTITAASVNGLNFSDVKSTYGLTGFGTYRAK